MERRRERGARKGLGSRRREEEGAGTVDSGV